MCRQRDHDLALVVLREEETVEDLADSMERFALRHLPVVGDDRLVRLVTHRDVLRAAITDGKRAARDPSWRVCAVISRDMMTVLPALPLALAADLLIERRARVCWSSTSAARWTAS